MASSWQVGHSARLLDDPPGVFVQTLDLPDAPFAPEFDGDPEGPFRPVTFADVPVLFRPDRAGAQGPAPSDGSAGRPRFDDDRRLLLGRDGLLSVLDHPSRASVRRWVRRVRSGRDASGGEWPVGTDALLRHTAAVLRSPRTTERQRSAVAAEFMFALGDAVAGAR